MLMHRDAGAVLQDPRILEAFLRIAERNTRNNLETCAMLAGTLRGGVFVVTTLIVPKQESTADTCDTLNEEVGSLIVDVFVVVREHRLSEAVVAFWGRVAMALGILRLR